MGLLQNAPVQEICMAVEVLALPAHLAIRMIEPLAGVVQEPAPQWDALSTLWVLLAAILVFFIASPPATRSPRPGAPA